MQIRFLATHMSDFLVSENREAAQHKREKEEEKSKDQEEEEKVEEEQEEEEEFLGDDHPHSKGICVALSLSSQG